MAEMNLEVRATADLATWADGYLTGYARAVEDTPQRSDANLADAIAAFLASVPKRRDPVMPGPRDTTPLGTERAAEDITRVRWACLASWGESLEPRAARWLAASGRGAEPATAEPPATTSPGRARRAESATSPVAA